MTENLGTEPHQRHALVTVGDRTFPMEADRIHVLGSGPQATVRLVHDSVAAAHATICFHQGRFIVEPVGDAWIHDADGKPVRGEVALEPGTHLRIGLVEIALTVSAPAAARARGHDADFSELMAQELRRAPWFAMSAAFHALAFLLLYLILAEEPPRSDRIVRFGMLETVGDAEVDFDAVLEPQFEDSSPPTPEIQPPPLMPLLTDEDLVEPFDDPLAGLPAFAGPESFLHRIINSPNHGDIFGKATGERFSTGFRKTVAGLRSSGLEIVFAFDSTGSMGPVLRATKERMSRMVKALHALVPDARIGVVTYRDSGQRERYLTRNVPLDRDLYRSLSFLSTVDADGGGDRPEAVLEALELAINQPWAPRARRVIVLIGDAPAHRETEGKLERMVRSFSSDGTSHVHAIITASELVGSPERDVQRSFERIAKAGRGTCVNSERDDTILKLVLSLAVGSEFRDNIDKLFDLVDERDGKIATRVLDMVRRFEKDDIRRELSRPVIDDDIVEALARSRSREVADFLVKLLTDGSLPPQGLHATGWALKGMLGIGEPLIDPEHPQRLEGPLAKRLEAMAASLR